MIHLTLAPALVAAHQHTLRHEAATERLASRGRRARRRRNISR